MIMSPIFFPLRAYSNTISKLSNIDKLNIIISRCLVISLLLALLSACGGGSRSNDPAPDPDSSNQQSGQADSGNDTDGDNDSGGDNSGGETPPADADGSGDDAMGDDSSPPTVSFTLSNTDDALINTVWNLTNTSVDEDGMVTGYSWDFGDGQTATTTDATHQYSQAGTYTITLTAAYDGGSVGQTATIEVYQAVFSDSLKTQFQTAVSTPFDASANKGGINVALYKAGYPVWEHASGLAASTSSAGDVDMTVNTPTMLYSITKTMISALVLRQVEAGRYALSDTVATVLADHADYAGINTTKINVSATVEQLLEHTSGIADYINNVAGITNLVISGTQNWKPADLLDLVEDDASGAGSYFYSNTNYVLLGMMAEQHGGGDLNTLLANQFFTPIGMDAVLLPQDATPSDIAHGFDDLAIYGSSNYGDLVSVQPFHMNGVAASTWAAGGVASNAASVAKWGYALYSDNGEAISAASRTTLFNSAPTHEDYGLGILRTDVLMDDSSLLITYGHSGGGAGGTTRLIFAPDLDLAVAIITNAANTTNNASYDVLDGSDLVSNIAQDIFQAYRNSL